MVTRCRRTTLLQVLSPSSPQDWEPESYQIAGARFLLENPEGALFLSPGLRKTSITLAAIKVLKGKGILRRALVVAPPRVCRSVWPAEIAKWKDFASLRVEVLHGPHKQAALERDADVYCVSYEGLEWLLGVTKEFEVRLAGHWLRHDPTLQPDYGEAVELLIGGKRVVVRTAQGVLDAAQAMDLGRKPHNDAERAERLLLAAAAVQFGAGKVRRVIKHDLTRFKLLNADTLIMDEISKLKHTNTARFDALRPVLGMFDRRWGLTGSPSANGLMNLFGIMYAIDLGKSLGQYITHFRRTFFSPSGYGGYTWVLQPAAEERIYAHIAPYVFRLAGEDFIKLPKLVKTTVLIDLPETARKAYDEIEHDFITELENGAHVITAVNSGAAGTKCRQIASGGIYLDRKVDAEGRQHGKREWHDLHLAKIEATRELVDEIGGSPVMVTYDFGHDLARLKKEFGKDTPHIGGGVTPRQSDAILRDWNAGRVEVLLVNFQSMAYGLNAQEGNACHLVMHSLIYDFELYDQLISRLLRSGNQSAKVFVYHVVARDTIDEAMADVLVEKRRTQDALQSAMREYTLRRYGRAIAGGKRKGS